MNATLIKSESRLINTINKTPIIPEIKAEQSIELLKELHILTRDGKLNRKRP